MNRRSLLQGFAAGAAGLLLPEYLTGAEPKRFWSLNRTMTRPLCPQCFWDQYSDPDVCQGQVDAWMEASDPLSFRHTDDVMKKFYSYEQARREFFWR